MPAVATSVKSIALVKLRRMVSLSGTFQAALGLTGTSAEKAAKALDHIFLKSAIGDDVTRPYAVVSAGEQFQWRSIASFSLWPSGSIGLYLTVDSNSAYQGDQASRDLDAFNFISGVEEDVADLADADDTGSAFGESHLNIRNMSIIGWGENPREEWETDGQFYEAGITVEWGNE